jgi:hypothetical protein
MIIFITCVYSNCSSISGVTELLLAYITGGDDSMLADLSCLLLSSCGYSGVVAALVCAVMFSYL